MSIAELHLFGWRIVLHDDGALVSILTPSRDTIHPLTLGEAEEIANEILHCVRLARLNKEFQERQ